MPIADANSSARAGSDANDAQLDLLREMAAYISPRPGSLLTR